LCMRRALLVAAVLITFIPLASGQMIGFRGGRGVAGFSRFGPHAPFFGNSNSFFFGSAPFGAGWGFGPNFFPPTFFPPRFARRRIYSPGYPAGYSSYPAWAYSYPGTGDYSAYSSKSSYYPDIYYEQNREQNRNVTRELDRLSDEVARLREERDARAAVPQAKNAAEPQRSTMLVFRDKHTEEVQNYAVVGQTLWTFNEQRAKKVPLADLDIDSTTKLNDERGIEFVLPNTP